MRRPALGARTARVHRRSEPQPPGRLGAAVSTADLTQPPGRLGATVSAADLLDDDRCLRHVGHAARRVRRYLRDRIDDVHAHVDANVGIEGVVDVDIHVAGLEDVEGC